MRHSQTAEGVANCLHSRYVWEMSSIADSGPPPVAPLRGPHAVGPVLAELRLLRGLTQAQAAEAVGVSRQTIIALEAGGVAKQVRTIMALLKAYGYRMEFHSAN